MINETEIKNLLKTMTEEQRLEVIRLCNIENNKSKEKDILLKLSNNYKCPHCQSTNIIKNGTASKYQQFKCKDCKKNYTIRTKTIFQNTHKSIKDWMEYIELFSQGLSLRKIVEKMNNKISLPTAFYWRHKIIKVMSNIDKNNKLDGIIEADETYFQESQKGSKNMTRQARKRGVGVKNDPISKMTYEKHKRGLSNNKVCVLTAIDRNKTTFNIPVGYGKINKDAIKDNLQRKLQDNSILITDGDKSYQVLKNVKLKQLKFGLVESKVYHMNNINSYHSGLKKFIQNFNGVATKYLDNYVNYFKNVRNKVDIFTELLAINYYCSIYDIKMKRACFYNPFTSERM